MAFDAPLALALPLLVAGFASGVHCLGMCGGIVGAFAARRGAPLGAARAVTPEWPRQLAFNAGRIASYAAAGAIVGSLGGAGAWVAGALPAQTVLFVLANAMLVLVGLYLAGTARALVRLEAIGAPLWRRLQPLAARLLPATTVPQSFAAGALWGWLPCGRARLLACNNGRRACQCPGVMRLPRNTSRFFMRSQNRVGGSALHLGLCLARQTKLGRVARACGSLGRDLSNASAR